MKNRIMDKLRSQTGASITWALLIFLVCTVVGSAVLVAGTAASGRMSKLSENDQRYYVVTSTAGVLRDTLDDSITVTRIARKTEGTMSYSISYGSNPDKILEAVVQALMHWPDASSDSTSEEDAFWKKDTIDSPTESKGTVTVTLESSESGLNGYTDKIGTVDVTMKIEKDGLIIAEVSNNGFSMQLVFEMIRSQNISTETDSSQKTDTFKWQLREARKIVA